jgi:hypothetical protein
MSRLPLTLETQLPLDLQSKFRKVTGADTGLSATYQALFASPPVGSALADLDELVRNRSELEPWIRLTIALTVAQERNCRPLWDSFEQLAREAGVADAVIDAIAAGTAPRGLLPKDGIWVQFALEVLRGQSRESTWQAVTHLAGDSGAEFLALTTCYYEMMTRLNLTFAMDVA